jgi:ubiquitin-conjugating enzyme E2 J2
MAVPESAKGCSTVARRRLLVEEKAMKASPPDFITAAPDPQNILEWYYCLQGPPGTPYEGGLYMGKVVFPGNYPFAPPAILMITPNGRFEVKKPLCLSISNYHPESWNPVWTIHTILLGLLAFMVGRDATKGSIEASEGDRRKFAVESQSQMTPADDAYAYPYLDKNGALHVRFNEGCKKKK